MNRNRIDAKELQKQIFESLGLDEAHDEPGLDRTKKQLNAEGISNQLSALKDHSQRKRKRMREMINYGSKNPANYDASQEMKELEWRLEVLRNDRKERQKRNNSSEQVTFEELYNRQKNKYAKFRERSKIKVSDPRYLDMIGSMQMRREKRKLDGMAKIDKHIESLDLNIKSHSLEGGRNGKSRKF